LHARADEHPPRSLVGGNATIVLQPGRGTKKIAAVRKPSYSLSLDRTTRHRFRFEADVRRVKLASIDRGVPLQASSALRIDLTTTCSKLPAGLLVFAVGGDLVGVARDHFVAISFDSSENNVNRSVESKFATLKLSVVVHLLRYLTIYHDDICSRLLPVLVYLSAALGEAAGARVITISFAIYPASKVSRGGVRLVRPPFVGLLMFPPLLGCIGVGVIVIVVAGVTCSSRRLRTQHHGRSTNTEWSKNSVPTQTV
jgi:hypothetical protein